MQITKLQIKQLLLLMTTCFFIAISLTSCEKDLYEEGIKNSSRDLNVTHVSLSGLDKATSSKINEKITLLKNLSKKTNAQGKFEYNSTLNIYIDTENGRLINNNGKLYYTFPMFRETEENLENIIFAPLASGEMETFFAKYNVTPEVFKDLTIEEIHNLNPEFQRIIYQDNFVTVEQICVEIYQVITVYNSFELNEGNGNPSSSSTTEVLIASYCDFYYEYSNGGSGDNGSGVSGTDENEGGSAGSVTTTPTNLTYGQRVYKNYIKNLLTNLIFGSCYAEASKEFKDSLSSYFGVLDINDETVTEASIIAFADQAITAVCDGLVTQEIATRIINLKIQLKTNQNLLLEIPCAEIPKWQALAQFSPPQSVKNKIAELDAQSLFTDYSIQYLDHAKGAAINLDYFPVNINTLPNNPANGLQFTPTQFLNHIRLNINSFVNTSISSFSPTTLSTGFNETAIWNSSNPLGAIIHIDIPFPAGDGSVVCSETNSNHWIFTTLEVPYGPFQGQDGTHPVSGNREFGLIQNQNGTYTFYTRGVDRMNDGFDQTMVNNLNVNPFANPDLLWNSLRNNIFNFVQNNSGSVQPLSSSPNVIYRPDWAKVKDVINGLRPISDLGCN